jgi:TolA protein
MGSGLIAPTTILAFALGVLFLANATAAQVGGARQNQCEEVRTMAQFYGDELARGHERNELLRQYGARVADINLINFVDEKMSDGTTTVQRAMDAAYDNCMSAASAPAISGTQSSETYADKARGRVRPYIEWDGETQGLATVIEVQCSPSGTLLSATIQRGSGNAQWDAAALKAVRNAAPMPTDSDGRAPAAFTITLRQAG